jgi:hypothetical protein
LDKHAYSTTLSIPLNPVKAAVAVAAAVATLISLWTVMATLHVASQVVRPSCSMQWSNSTVSLELVGGNAKSICGDLADRGGALVSGPVAGKVVCSVTRNGVEATVHDTSPDGADGHLLCAYLAAQKSFE